MANKNEAKIKFTADTSDLSQSIKSANADIKGLTAELKLNEAEFKNTGDAANYMETKEKLLQAEVEANERKQEALNGKLEIAKQIFGENSEEAKTWARQLTNAKAEGEKLKTQINDLNNELTENKEVLENAGTAAQDAGDGFTVLKGAIANLVSDGISSVCDGMKELATDSSSAYAQFAAQTGTATNAMEGYKQAIQDVYMDNFGESLEDVAEKMSKVKEVTGEVDPSKLKQMTENAITLEDTFDMDMSETLRGVNALMTHFGLTAEEAFDLMASGAQNGLNYSDELGDNVAEYSGKFEEAGYSASDYFQLLQNGSQGGAYNLDKVNDSINEVTTRLADGTIEEGIDSFSSQTKETFQAWKDGGATQKDVIDSIVEDIKGTTNEQEKMNLAALAFGTMAEDGGTKFIEALSSTGTTFDDTKGKMEDLAAVKYDDLESSISGLGRSIKTNVLQPVVDEVAPKVTEVIQNVTEKIPDVVTKVSEMLPVIGKVGAVIGIVTTAIGLQSAVTAVKTAMDKAQVKTLGGLIAAEWAHATAAAAALAPYILIVAAIAAVIAIVVLLVKNWDTVKKKCTEVAQIVGEKWKEVKTSVTTAVNGIKTTVTTVFNGVKSTAITVWNAIKTAVTTPINTAKTLVSTAVNGIKSTVTSVFNGLKSSVTSIFNGIKTAITSPITTAKNTLSNLVSGIKNLFSGLHISLPHIKVPHFRISGGEAPWGIAGRGTAPSIGIEWYAKGAILKKATAIGTNTKTGKKMVGGESGYEALAPIDVLQGYVEAAVDNAMAASTIDYDLLGEKIAHACARLNVSLELDGRQMGRMVRGYV